MWAKTHEVPSNKTHAKWRQNVKGIAPLMMAGNKGTLRG